MIRIDFGIGISIYIIIILGGVFSFWLFSRRQKDKDLSLDPKLIWFCSICAYTYVNTKEDFISTCPRCGSYNKR